MAAPEEPEGNCGPQHAFPQHRQRKAKLTLPGTPTQFSRDVFPSQTLKTSHAYCSSQGAITSGRDKSRQPLGRTRRQTPATSGRQCTESTLCEGLGTRQGYVCSIAGNASKPPRNGTHTYRTYGTQPHFTKGRHGRRDKIQVAMRAHAAVPNNWHVPFLVFLNMSTPPAATSLPPIYRAWRPGNRAQGHTAQPSFNRDSTRVSLAAARMPPKR